MGPTPQIVLGRDRDSVSRMDSGVPSRVSHRTTGGVTDWKGTVSTSGWRYEGWVPKVRRDVSHVIKYSEKPECCDKVPPFAHIGATELLSVYGPWDPVVFHTPFPLKVMQTMLESFFLATSSLDPRTSHETRQLSLRFSERTSHPPDLNETMIPGIVTPLSGKWVDAGKVTVEACKMEDTSISTQMWDLHILLVLPWLSTVFLTRIRTWLLGAWQRRLTGCLTAFLRQKYGGKWQELLAFGRQQRGITEGATHKQGGGYGGRSLSNP